MKLLKREALSMARLYTFITVIMVMSLALMLKYVELYINSLTLFGYFTSALLFGSVFGMFCVNWYIREYELDK